MQSAVGWRGHVLGLVAVNGLVWVEGRMVVSGREGANALVRVQDVRRARAEENVLILKGRT